MATTNNIPNPFSLDACAHDSMYDYRALSHLFYSTPIDSEKLQAGFRKLVATIPWVAWRVKGFPAADPTEHPYLEPGDHEYFRLEDWTKDPTHPTFAELRARGFPMSHIPTTDYCKVSPGPGHPMGGYGTNDVRPAWFLQLNQLRGGSILSCSVHHAVHDITGTGNVLDMLSRLCEGQELSAQEIELANTPRLNLADVSDVPVPANLQLQTFEPMVGIYNHPKHEGLKWYAFTASAEATAAVKAKAMESKPADIPYFSTDDALVAFHWQHILRARNYDPKDYDHPTSCSRPVNIRKYLGLPKEYTGLALNGAEFTKTVGEVLQAPLGELASGIRQALGISEPGAYVAKSRKVIKYLQQPDARRLGYVVPYDIEYDSVNTSWRLQKISGFTFGTGCGADAMRRGQATPWKGGSSLMPIDADGNTTLLATLTAWELGALLEDEEYMEVYKFVG